MKIVLREALGRTAVWFRRGTEMRTAVELAMTTIRRQQAEINKLQRKIKRLNGEIRDLTRQSRTRVL